MSEDLVLTLHADSAELVNSTVNEIWESLLLSLLEKQRFDLALTGGTLGNHLVAELLIRLNKAGDLTGLHIWFSDERFVPLDSTERNSRLLADGLTNQTVKVHFVKSTNEVSHVQEAATLYEAELREVVMDICVLGLGPDAHVASLFPERWGPQRVASTKAIAILDSPKSPPRRVSFSIEFINMSHQVWIIAAGGSKAQAVRQVLQSDHSVPAGKVKGKELTRLIIDRAANSTD